MLTKQLIDVCGKLWSLWFKHLLNLCLCSVPRCSDRRHKLFGTQVPKVCARLDL